MSSNEEWRVEVDLDDESHGYTLRERIRAHDLDDEARERLGGRMIVTRDGPRLFLYATTEQAAREGERVIRELLAADDLTADVSVTRWDEEQDAWVAADTGEVVESAREDDGDGHFEWFVLVEADDPEALAERLRAEGMPVERRGRYVLVGSDDDEEVQALAERVRAIAGPDAEVQVRADLEVPSPGFAFFEAHKPGIARDLGL
jgi:hypothetical protein